MARRTPGGNDASLSQWLGCAVSPGQFPSEYALSGTQYNGKSFSLFAPSDAVRVEPGRDRGLVRVDVVDARGDLALVRLPSETFENGQYVTVKSAELKA